ncbi:HlyD family secretion protein [Lichenifustis flavocetrariae]|uniref:HlyD family secretion protein n=1 Tax=Lichenifustis flavocetrariae TaxID=2949735 RepID=A0AA41YUR3_9HYPH|nr:HlyD family secretion protein [Lichenifustis flavocetrariae]MCW6508924.1 HlyD family secretion protein [Lichenifustis flavocetrariae]
MANNADRDDEGDEPNTRRGRRGRDVIDLGKGDDRGRRSGRYRDDSDEDDADDRAEPRADRGTRSDDRQRRGESRRRDNDDRDDSRDHRDERDDDRRSEGRKTEDSSASSRDTKHGEATSDADKGSADKGSKDKDKSGQDEAAAAQESRRKRRPLIIGLVAVVALLGILGGVYYWFSHRFKVGTDDAYTDGNTVSIAPQVSGLVVALEVNDNQFVHKGDVLIRIDPRQFNYDREQAQGTLDSNNAQIANQQLGVEIAKKNFPASLQLAKANLESAQANLLLQKSNYDRQKSLPRQATTQQEVDTATSNYQQAQAQVDQAEARVVQAEPVQQNIGQSQEQVSQLRGQAEQAKGRLDQANLNVEWSVVRAPQDGWVTRRNVNTGNYVTSGTQIMSLVTTDVWVTANYKETELDGMRPGQQVTISVDAYPDLDLRGHVDSIQHGSGSKFSAFPAENATGNFIKIVQRVPVKIVIDSGLKPDEPLPLGISVVPTVMLK